MNNEYHNKYFTERYHKRKIILVKKLGGVCVDCGVADKLEFDHIDPSTKLFTITDRLAGGPWEEILEEVVKCQLLCKPCHNAKTRLQNNIQDVKNNPHLHGVTGAVRYCKCSACAEYKRNYQREYMRKYRSRK